MKKIIIIVFLLLINIAYTKDRLVSSMEIIDKNGLVYIIGEETPYTGQIIDIILYDNKGCQKTKWIYHCRGGKKDGFSVLYFKNNKKWARGNYNKEKGESIIYFSDGKVSERINYINNELDGDWITYGRDGKILSRKKYKCGHQIK